LLNFWTIFAPNVKCSKGYFILELICREIYQKTDEIYLKMKNISFKIFLILNL